MRKVITIVLAVLVAFVCLGADTECVTASAMSGDFLIMDKATLMYRLPNNEDASNSFFIIPQTYYVKILGEADFLTDYPSGVFSSISDYYYIEYIGIRGFVKRSDVAATVTISNVVSPYYEQVLALAKSTNLRDSMSVISTTQAVAQDASIHYISYINEGETLWYYISILEGSSTKYGYVLASSTTDSNIPITMPAHALSTAGSSLEQSGNTLPAEKKDTENNLQRTLITVGLLVPTILLLAVIFKPNKNSKPTPAKK